MTVTAYDGQNLAADGLATWGSDERCPTPCTKIRAVSYKGRRALVAGAGNVAYVPHHLRHYFFQTENDRFDWLSHSPIVGGDSNTGILVVELLKQSHRAFIMTCDGKVTEVTGEKVSDGTGSGYALGAMDAGASAREAVELAIKRCQTCGPPVQNENIAEWVAQTDLSHYFNITEARPTP